MAPRQIQCANGIGFCRYECLLRLVRCEAEIEAILDRDEELSDFRERAADLVVETQFILGPEFAMGELLGACQSEGVGWNDIEAALYLMSCRLAFGLKPDSEVAPQLLEAISTIRADDHPQLRVTSVKLLGDLARLVVLVAVNEVTSNNVCHCVSDGVRTTQKQLQRFGKFCYTPCKSRLCVFQRYFRSFACAKQREIGSPISKS